VTDLATPLWYGYPPRPWPPLEWPNGTGGEPTRTYQRMLRVRSYRGWKPLVGLLLFVVSYLIVLVVVVIGPGVVALALGVSEQSLNDQGSPLVFLLGNLSLAALIPCAILAFWVVHRIRPGFLASVAGRIRWKWLLLCSAIACVVVIVGLGISFFLPTDPADQTADVGPAPAATFVALAMVIVLTTPLQAAGEEYAFRGYLTQIVGAWVRWPVVPIVLTSLLFAFAHGAQNLPLYLDRFAFGLVAGFLVWRTGGLEASIALHTFNNLVVLLIGASFADFGEQLSSTQAPWSILVFDGVQLLVYVVIIEFVRRSWVRRGALTLHTRQGFRAVDGVATGVPRS